LMNSPQHGNGQARTATLGQQNGKRMSTPSVTVLSR
jgi:hypothetical protein